MTQRDRKILTVLVFSLVGAVVGFMLLNQMFLSPSSNYDKRIAELDEKNDVAKDNILKVIQGRKLMEEKRKISLPVKQFDASNRYIAWVDFLLTSCGLKAVDLKPEEIRAANPNQNQPGGGAKKPEHTILTVNVNAKGTMAAVVDAFEKLQRTPLVHRIKSFTIGHQESNAKGVDKDSLNLTMTLEAMIVAGTDPKKTFPDWMTVSKTLAMLPPLDHKRNLSYSDIANNNFFLGSGREVIEYVNQPRIPDVIEEPVGKALVLEYMRLVHTDPDNQVAYLRQLLFKTGDTKVTADPKIGKDVFEIYSETREPMLKAHLLRVDQRDIYIQVGIFIYAVHIGHTVSDGMRHTLSDAELKSLDLTKLIKPEEKTKGPAADAQKGAGKKGRAPQQQ
jgi:hypothetical protein